MLNHKFLYFQDQGSLGISNTNKTITKTVISVKHDVVEIIWFSCKNIFYDLRVRCCVPKKLRATSKVQSNRSVSRFYCQFNFTMTYGCKFN